MLNISISLTSLLQKPGYINARYKAMLNKHWKLNESYSNRDQLFLKSKFPLLRKEQILRFSLGSPLIHTENFEMREQKPGFIDLEVLEFMKNQAI